MILRNVLILSGKDLKVNIEGGDILIQHPHHSKKKKEEVGGSAESDPTPYKEHSIDRVPAPEHVNMTIGTGLQSDDKGITCETPLIHARALSHICL